MLLGAAFLLSRPAEVFYIQPWCHVMILRCLEVSLLNNSIREREACMLATFLLLEFCKCPHPHYPTIAEKAWIEAKLQKVVEWVSVLEMRTNGSKSPLWLHWRLFSGHKRTLSQCSSPKLILSVCTPMWSSAPFFLQPPRLRPKRTSLLLVFQGRILTVCLLNSYCPGTRCTLNVLPAWHFSLVPHFLFVFVADFFI